MKMLTSTEGQSKSSTNNTRKVNTTANQHEDHVLLLDSLTANLKDELKRGLSIVDSIVNQLAQAKWVLLNVDKTLEEMYENCPACDINANKKSNKTNISGGGGPVVGSKTKHKVLPMVSGYTFQRPSITVRRVEQEPRQAAARSRNNPAPAAAPTSTPESSTPAPIAHSSSHPPNPRTSAPPKRTSSSKKKSAPKRKPPPKKPSSAAGATTSTSSALMSTPPATPSTSRRSADATATSRPQLAEVAAGASQKRPGPKSRTLAHDGEPPVLTREGTTDDETVEVSNELGEQDPGSASSSAKSPPTLVAFNADNQLKVTSFSLSRDSGPTSFQESTRNSETSATNAGSSSVVSSSTSNSGKRSSSQAHTPGTGTSDDLEKKRKVGSSGAAFEKKNDGPSMEDLLQLKFQKFRDQQRKRELERKAAAAKAESNDGDVVEIPISEQSDNNTTTEEKEGQQQEREESGSENAQDETSQGNVGTVSMEAEPEGTEME